MRKALIIPSGIALVAVVTLAGMIAFGTGEPPTPMTAISDPFKNVDFGDLPEVATIAARDNSRLAFRFYAAGAAPDYVVIAIHGSSATSATLHPLAKALRDAGIAVYAPDIRGHGATGRRGDIDRATQLDDDLADLIAAVRARQPQARLVLLGYSSGGGFALHAAGSTLGKKFDRVVLLAPMLGPNAPTLKPRLSEWVTAFVPRIIALTILDHLGIHAFEHLPVLAFAIPPEYADVLSGTYSFVLMQAFGTSDYAADLRNTKVPLTVLVGTQDELFFADRFAPTIKAVKSDTSVLTVPGVGHVGLILEPRALSAIAAAIRGMRPASIGD